MTNPLQYIKNYFAARRMKRERERAEREERGREFVLYIMKRLQDVVEGHVRDNCEFPSGGISVPITDEGAEYIVPPPEVLCQRIEITLDEDLIACKMDGELIRIADPALRLMAYRHNLKIAIEREDYELAAKLRDEIKNKEA